MELVILSQNLLILSMNLCYLSIEVLVEIDNKKARFFKLKKFLSSQKTVETKDDGSLVLSFKVTQEMEMEELVKKWIPYMKVIKPLSLKEKIENDIKKYLK